MRTNCKPCSQPLWPPPVGGQILGCPLPIGLTANFGSATPPWDMPWGGSTVAGSTLVLFCVSQRNAAGAPTIVPPAGYTTRVSAANNPVRLNIATWDNAPSQTTTGPYTITGSNILGATIIGLEVKNIYVDPSLVTQAISQSSSTSYTSTAINYAAGCGINVGGAVCTASAFTTIPGSWTLIFNITNAIWGSIIAGFITEGVSTMDTYSGNLTPSDKWAAGIVRLKQV